MLPLDDPLWTRLQQAYGSASNIPDLLRQLKVSTETSDDQRELWRQLWGSLCHQGDVYTASYAAVPHIVQIAIEGNAHVAFDSFALPAAIEVGRNMQKSAPQIPVEIAHGYHHSLGRLAEAAAMRWNYPWDRNMLRSVTAAQSVAKGDIELAGVLLNLDDDWIAKIVNDDR
jgi:hypothetical protein